MFTKEEWLNMGNDYIKNDLLASHLLEYIETKGHIDHDDLDTFHIITADQLTPDQWDELDHDGFEKFYLGALIGYGFIENIEDGWKYVENRPKRVEEIINGNYTTES